MNLNVTRREAAALHRLLSAYLATETADPGLPDLANLAAVVEVVDQDHSRYHAVLGDEPGCTCVAPACVKRRLRALRESTDNGVATASWNT